MVLLRVYRTACRSILLNKIPSTLGLLYRLILDRDPVEDEKGRDVGRHRLHMFARPIRCDPGAPNIVTSTGG